MKLARRVWFRNIPLDEIDPSVVIRRVESAAPRESVKSVSKMGGFGQRITARHWETMECSVTYAIDKPKKDLAGRRAVFDAVNAAVSGKSGWLSTTESGNKRLWVDKVVLPEPGDMWDWTNEYTIVFQAYSVPFWQDSIQTSKSATMDSGSGELVLTVNGNMPTVLEGFVQNKSGSTLDDISISVGGKTFTMEGLGIANNEQFFFYYENDGLLKLTKGIYQGVDETSVYSKRTADSADDLIVSPGENAITVEAGGKVFACGYAYGRYA